MPYGFVRRSLPWVSCLCLAAACAAGGSGGNPGGPGGSSSGGNNSSSGSTSSSGSGGTSSGTSSGVHVSDDSGVGIMGDACQQLDVQFLPKVPLVYVLVDRSGSMFQQVAGPEGGTTDEWDPLRTATLAVIQGLQSQVAFGFSSYTGINPNTTPNMCPILTPVPVAVNNYTAIDTVYAPLGMPAFKAETPAEMALEQTGLALTQASAQLAAQADAGTLMVNGGVAQPGAQYILFVTDGETDFCDDGDPVCPADAVTAEIQKLNMQGVTTLILGIASDQSNISAPVLQSFANAGAGLPALAPPNGSAGAPLAPTDIYNQCNSVAGWHTLFTAAGLQMNQALGTYAPSTTTNAAVFSPSATDVNDLTNQIGSALAGVKSCSFDLQGKIKVDLANASEGSVMIDGVSIPFDATNGWTMSSATQLDLVGTACNTWRSTGKDIKFKFPCDVIIIVN
ncbi:MAG TPA: hypothetical protein VGM06_06045 [Polyangiaceae bacterium]